MDGLKAAESKDEDNADNSDMALANIYSDISDAESDVSDFEKQPEKTEEILVSENEEREAFIENKLDHDQDEGKQGVAVDFTAIDADNDTESIEDHGQKQAMRSSDIPLDTSSSVEDQLHIKYSDDDNDREMNLDCPKTIIEDMNPGVIGNFQIQTITIDEDDDLFDFQHTEESKQVDNDKLGDNVDNCETKSENEEEGHEDSEVSQTPQELQKFELYKYLTASNVADVKSSEVTPVQTPLQTPLASDHDSNEEEDSGSESNHSDSGSYSSVTSENENQEKPGHERNGDVNEKVEDIQEEESLLEPEEPEATEPIVENDVVEKPRPTPVRKTFRPRLTKKMRNTLAKTQERIKKSKEVTDKWLKELELPKNLDLSNPVKLDINELNQYLTCGLCQGYLYEASTVTECMHTFCKTCIVKHCMEVSLNCPVCNILIHPTDPFVNIRLDRMIQDIVYKLLPDIADAEMKNIREFYAEHPDVEAKELNNCPDRPKPSPAKSETFTEMCPLVSLVLESDSESPNDRDQLEKKYVRVKGTATVGNLSHFLKMKLQLQDTQNVHIYCHGDQIAEDKSTLQTIKERFFSKEEECLMFLQYRVHEP